MTKRRTGEARPFPRMLVAAAAACSGGSMCYTSVKPKQEFAKDLLNSIDNQVAFAR